MSGLCKWTVSIFRRRCYARGSMYSLLRCHEMWVWISKFHFPIRRHLAQTWHHVNFFKKEAGGHYTGEAAKKLFWFNFHRSCTINRIPAIFSGSLDIILTKFKSWKIRLVRVKRKKSWFESSIEEELVLSDFLLKLTLEQMSQICTILPRVSSNDPLPFFFFYPWSVFVYKQQSSTVLV